MDIADINIEYVILNLYTIAYIILMHINIKIVVFISVYNNLHMQAYSIDTIISNNNKILILLSFSIFKIFLLL